MVYAIAGMVDSLTGETEEGMAVREIKKLGLATSLLMLD